MTDSKPRSKVARLIEEYGLEGIGADLEQKWTRPDERVGLRSLADEFNKAVLREALESSGDDPLEGEVDNLYRLLTDDDVTSGVRSRARNRIEAQDCDVASLENDFVSYQSIRTYLKDYRGASPPGSETTPEERRDSKLDTIQRLMNRLGTVTDQSLRELANAGYLTLGEFNTVVSVRVHCTDCNRQQAVTELVANGGCDCEAE